MKHIQVSIRKVVFLLFLFILCFAAVFLHDITKAQKFKEKGISGYAQIGSVSTKKLRKGSSTTQIYTCNGFYKTVSIDFPGCYPHLQEDNLVRVLINPNQADDFILGDKSTPLLVLARFYRFEDWLMGILWAFLIFLGVSIVFSIVTFKSPLKRFFENSSTIKISVLWLSFSVTGIVLGSLVGAAIFRHFEQNKHIKTIANAGIYEQYKLFKINKDTVGLLSYSALTILRSDSTAIYFHKYHTKPFSVNSPDSCLYAILIKNGNKIALNAFLYNRYSDLVQSGYFELPTTPFPNITINSNEPEIQFSSNDTARLFKNGIFTVDTIRQFIIKQKDVRIDTLTLIDAFSEKNDNIAVFTAHQKYDRPSLRLSKSKVYSGCDLWYNPFYNTPCDYRIVYKITNKKPSDFSFFGEIFLAEKLTQNK